jgi:O-antigen ligase
MADSGFSRRKRIILIIVFFVVFMLPLTERILSVTTFDSTAISNTERIGSWIAALRVSAENPFIGVGFGLVGGFMFDHYPEIFYLSYSADKWTDTASQFGSTVFALPPRLFAELGIIGCFFLFVPIAYLIGRIVSIRRSAMRQGATTIVYFSNSIILIWLGFVFSSMGVDSLVFPGYWFILTISVWFVSNFSSRQLYEILPYCKNLRINNK